MIIEPFFTSQFVHVIEKLSTLVTESCRFRSKFIFLQKSINIILVYFFLCRIKTFGIYERFSRKLEQFFTCLIFGASQYEAKLIEVMFEQQ